MKYYWKYFKSVLQHKYYVFVAGAALNVPIWRLVVHDWQKFSPYEFGAYARKFAMLPNEKHSMAKWQISDIEQEFTYAWLHHENTAPHHWGYWIPRSGNHTGRPLEMPETYVREMIADWMGASKAYTGNWDMVEWLNTQNENKTWGNMHTDTFYLIVQLLYDLGYGRTKEGKFYLK